MRINGFRDWYRFVTMAMTGYRLAARVKLGLNMAQAWKHTVPGCGNTEGRQTDWTGRRTQEQESARRLRQYGGPYFHGQSTPLYSTFPPHPHSAKLAAREPGRVSKGAQARAARRYIKDPRNGSIKLTTTAREESTYVRFN